MRVVSGGVFARRMAGVGLTPRGALLWAGLWYECLQAPPPEIPYSRTDGFDLYIDAARLLPSNVTITKVCQRLARLGLCGD